MKTTRTPTRLSAASDRGRGGHRSAPTLMSLILFIEQLLNGLQFGLMLFLMAAGLTLVFGVMGLINLAHGSLYMVGAFACAGVATATGSFWLGLVAALAAAAAAGALVELVVIRRLYTRDHLDQVLATFALILIFSEGDTLAVRVVPPLPICSAASFRRGDLAGRDRILPLSSCADRGRSGGRRRVMLADQRHAHRHPDPRGRGGPPDDRGPRRRHWAALHAGLRTWRGTGGPRRRTGRDNPVRAGRLWASRC